MLRNPALTAIAPLLLAAPALAQPLYTVTDLGRHPDYTYSTVPLSLNSAGQVVGWVQGSSLTRAFVWTQATGLQVNRFPDCKAGGGDRRDVLRDPAARQRLHRDAAPVCPDDDVHVVTAAAEDRGEMQPRRGRDHLQVRGEVKAVRSVPLTAPSSAGDLQILALTKNGESVKKGDVVVRFDPVPVERTHAEKLSELKQAEEEIGKTEAQYRIQEQQSETDLVKAGIGDGCYGFSIAFSETLLPYARHVLHLRPAGSAVDLPSFPLVLTRDKTGLDPTVRFVLGNVIAEAKNAQSSEELAPLVSALVGFLDAASGLLRPGSVLRSKILVMAAILEASPAFADDFLPRAVHPVALFGQLALHGSLVVVRALLGPLVWAAATRSRA